MLRSMTGFGRGLAESRFGAITIEIKSLNYKFFEVVSKLPANLAMFEDFIRDYLQKKIPRGRLNLSLVYEKKGDGQNELYIDKSIARHYYNMMYDLKKLLRLNGDISISQIISFPGVIAYRSVENKLQKIRPLLEKALSDACLSLLDSKEREGKMLKINLEHVVDSISRSLEKIKRRTPLVVKDYKDKLIKNISDITRAKRIFNPKRIEEEIAIFARSCDISEEVHRVYSHIHGFKKALFNSGEVGRHLDFIAQEVYREANTIGAKANDFSISKEVIKIKSLIEKIREQVQNVE